MSTRTVFFFVNVKLALGSKYNMCACGCSSHLTALGGLTSEAGTAHAGKVLELL
jgi:hypothetical protein